MSSKLRKNLIAVGGALEAARPDEQFLILATMLARWTLNYSGPNEREKLLELFLAQIRDMVSELEADLAQVQRQ